MKKQTRMQPPGPPGTMKDVFWFVAKTPSQQNNLFLNAVSMEGAEGYKRPPDFKTKTNAQKKNGIRHFFSAYKCDLFSELGGELALRLPGYSTGRASPVDADRIRCRELALVVRV